MTTPDIEAIMQERDRALLSLDEDSIRAFLGKYDIPISAEPVVFWASVHKARTAISSFPMEARTFSKRWLASHGFESEDDGDVPT